MKELEKRPFFPSELVSRLKIGFPTISKNLKKLEKKGLIVCETPKQHKGKLYNLTSEGNEILQLLREIYNSH